MQKQEQQDQGTYNICFTKPNRVVEARSSWAGWEIAVEINTFQLQKNKVNVSLICTEVTLTNIAFKSLPHMSNSSKAAWANVTDNNWYWSWQIA